MSEISIYTDGSSRGNPGPGGWGAIIINDDKSQIPNPKSQVREMGGRDEMTTNNKMEMKAAIEALRSLSPIRQAQDKENHKVEIFTDSEYLMKGITLWIKGWQKNNWKTKSKQQVLNRDLWEELLEESEKRQVEWKKVVGHSGHELNDRCDLIATSFADGKNLNLFRGTKEEYQKFLES